MKRRIIVNLTQEPDAQFYRIAAPLVGTVKLAIGEVVTRERVQEWLCEPLITVRVIGITPSAEAEQLDLFSLDEPKRKRAAKLPKQSAPAQLAIAK